VLTQAAATAVSEPSPLPLVLAEAAADKVFAPAPLPLVLAEAAAPTVFASALPPTVLAEDRGRAELLACRGERVLLILVVTSLCPPGCMPLQPSLLAHRSSLWAIRVIQHPAQAAADVFLKRIKADSIFFF